MNLIWRRKGSRKETHDCSTKTMPFKNELGPFEMMDFKHSIGIFLMENKINFMIKILEQETHFRNGSEFYWMTFRKFFSGNGRILIWIWIGHLSWKKIPQKLPSYLQCLR
jgi:hypothetical protein